MLPYDSAKSPEDARIITVLTLLRAYSDRGHDGEVGITLVNLHRTMTYLINTITWNPVLARLQNISEVSRRNHYHWLDGILSGLARTEVVEVGTNFLAIRPGARQVFIDKLEKKNGAFQLEGRESAELLRSCHQAVSYYNGLTTRERCE